MGQRLGWDLEAGSLPKDNKSKIDDQEDEMTDLYMAGTKYLCEGHIP